MQTWTPLFSSIVTSSIWSESKETKIVWITLLALKDRFGKVDGAVPGLARVAGVTVKECEAALKVLESADSYSRTQEHEGKRIRKVDGGWLVLNHLKHRDAIGGESRREYKRRWQAEKRAKLRDGKPLKGEREYVEAVRNGASEDRLIGILEKNLPHA